jgi:HEAT repeat protein
MLLRRELISFEAAPPGVNLKMRINDKDRLVGWLITIVAGVVPFSGTSDVFGNPACTQEPVNATSLTPLQLEIEKQRIRLSSADVEDRRDALMRLGSLHSKDASRVALAGLGDQAAIVKVSAAEAILSLPSDESARSLIPLLVDKDEFVRRETAYALGKTGSPMAVAALTELLLNGKIAEVRGAAAVALGYIGDEKAVAPLVSILNPQIGAPTSKRKQKKKQPENPFVLRAAARSLGQIGSRAGLPALLHALQDEQGDPDVRRESATALGAVGDSSALPSLRDALTAVDPYLSQAAKAAIHKITSDSAK